MAYSDFKTLNQVLGAFNLSLINRSGLFSQVEPIAPSPKLSEQLADTFELALAIDTEKARSELVVAPILLEVYRRFSPHLSLFSGVSLSVDAALGLSGECDFILSASTNQLEVSAPVLAIVEAKNNDIKSGLGQCAAQLVGSWRLNESGQKTVPIYGAVTTGSAWRFMRLQANQLEVDLSEYFVPPQLASVLGILCQPFTVTGSV